MKKKSVYFIYAVLFFLFSCSNQSGITVPIGETVKKYQVNFSVESGNGKLILKTDAGKLLSSGVKVKENEEVTFIAEAADGFIVDEWIGITAEPKNAKTVTVNVNENLNVKVKFRVVKTFTLNYSVDDASVGKGTLKVHKAGGSLVNSGSTVKENEEITFIAEAADGFIVDEWIGITAEPKNAKTVTVNVNENLNVKVKFKVLDKFEVRFDVLGDPDTGILQAFIDGKEKNSPILDVPEGTKIVLKAIPVKTGYVIGEWHGINAPPLEGTLWEDFDEIEITVTCNIHIQILFEKQVFYSVNFKVDPASTGTGQLIVRKAPFNFLTLGINSGVRLPKNTKLLFSASPAPNSSVESWTGISADPSDKSEVLLRLNDDLDVTVKFNLNNNMNNTPPNDKTFTVNSIELKMKGIKEVKDAVLGGVNGGGNNASHFVSLSQYLIAETETTQELYEAVTGKNPSFFRAENTYFPVEIGEIQAKRPVENVNWYEAIAFCNLLTQKTGLGDSEIIYFSDSDKQNIYTFEDAEKRKEPYPDWSKKGFRLPTEAEWEFAARAESDFDYSGSNLIDEVAWFSKNSGVQPKVYDYGRTHQVGLKKPNAYGLYDMTGNVWEWCWDKYGPIYSTDALGKDPTSSLHEAAGESRRIKRGGCWRFGEERAFCTYRSFHYPQGVEGQICDFADSGSINDNYLGFRVVCRP